MLYAHKTADIVLLIVAALAVFLLAVIFYAGSHGPIARGVAIEPCAVVQIRGQEPTCR